jgi:hypothetical protein
MSLYDSIMSDTVGVVYRGATGNVDPWTKQEIVDNEAASQIQAGADPATAQDNAEANVTATLQDFTLGGDDRVGADPSQASISLPSLQSLLTAAKSVSNDNGSGCGITNLGGCFQVPSWVMWAGAAALALGALYVLAPYVGLADRLTRRS